MPAVSKKQRIAMSIAEHSPEKLYKRNKGMLKMSKGQLHDFSITKEKGLPVKKIRKVPTVAKEKKYKGKSASTSFLHRELSDFRSQQKKRGL